MQIELKMVVGSLAELTAILESLDPKLVKSTIVNEAVDSSPASPVTKPITKTVEVTPQIVEESKKTPEEPIKAHQEPTIINEAVVSSPASPAASVNTVDAEAKKLRAEATRELNEAKARGSSVTIPVLFAKYGIKGLSELPREKYTTFIEDIKNWDKNND